MKKLVVLLLCILTLAPAQKRPFTIADLYRLKSIASLQLSKDGKQVVFTVTEQFLKEGKTNADIYAMNIDGSGLRRLTSNPAADYSPNWMPDGTSILFISARKDGPQVWRLQFDGGEPEQITSISTGINSLTVAPDGKGFLFATDVYPEFGADDAKNKKTDETRENGPVQAHMADRLLYRHWTAWSDGKKTHTFYFDLGTKQHVDLTAGEHDAPGFGMSDAVFSPDGREVCFVSNHDEREAETTNKDLFLVGITGGEGMNLTPSNKACDDGPV
jgi:Tol biopolymer transport system component